MFFTKIRIHKDRGSSYTIRKIIHLLHDSVSKHSFIRSFNNNRIIVFSLFIFIPTYLTQSLRNMDLHAGIYLIDKLLLFCPSTDLPFHLLVYCLFPAWFKDLKVNTLSQPDMRCFFLKVCLFQCTLKIYSSKTSKIKFQTYSNNTPAHNFPI